MSLVDPSPQRGVGRSREFATAAFARDTARAGRGSVLAVTGMSGMGKTWFCEALAEVAAEEGFGVGWGSCGPTRDTPPLWPWQHALAELGNGETDALFGHPPAPDSPEWFAHCAAVVDHLRALAEERPNVVILDDAHIADEATLRLAQFVARHVRGLPLVLVVAHQPLPELDALDRDATSIALHGFGAAEAAEVFAARGVEGVSDADIAFVVAATGGLPFEVRRVADSAKGADGVVRSVVDRRLAQLSPEMLFAAACAAVLDFSPRLSDVGAITVDKGINPLALATELEQLGLVTVQLPDGMTFTHEQVRTALEHTVGHDGIVDINLRAAVLLERGAPSTERQYRRARHALAAARLSAGDGYLAISIAQDAAAALVASNEAERAAELLAAACETHEAAGLGRPSAALLAAHAQAVLRCGRLASARELFERAALAADDDQDATSLAIAALGLGGVWLAEQRSPVDRERILALQARARDALPDDEAALRLRLRVRLAAEQSYATGDLESIEAEVEAARALCDAAVLAEALSLYHHTLLGPEHRALRPRVAHEMVAAAAAANDNSLSLMALLWLTADQFLDGNPQAERTLGVLHERAETLSGHHAAYIAGVMDVMLLQRAGRLADAERAANEAFEAGMQVGDADTVAYFGSQIVILRWIAGRSAEVLELAAETAQHPTLTPANHAFNASFAALAAECGELDRARAALTRMRGRLHAIPQNSAWLATMFSAVEAARRVGDLEVAREAAELLEPYADFPVLGSLAVICLGSTRRPLGLAALTLGDIDQGIAWLEAAIADDERLGNRPLAAMTMADLALAYAARNQRDDRRAALDLLDRAIREADAMDIPVRAEQWRQLRSEIIEPSAAPVISLVDEETGTIERRGTSWVLGVAGRKIVVPDLLGMNYLARLLTNPGVEFAAAALVAESGTALAGVAAPRDQPVLDDRALAAYRRRVADLEDDIAEAERNADTERAARARLELDAVIDELSRTTNVFGKARAFASSDERARTAVQKAVRRTLAHIQNVDPALGDALRDSVQTGRTCAYRPGPGAPARFAPLSAVDTDR